MSGCGDLCTAAKCQELENRISALEQALELLEASFEAHTNQDIPQAHDYQPKVEVGLAVNSSDNSLKVFVKVDEQSDDETTTLPIPDQDVEVGLAVNSNDNSLKVFVKVGDQSDDETTILPKYEPRLQVDADIYDGTLAINVQVDDANDIGTVNLPIPEIIQGIDGQDGKDGKDGIDGRDGERGLRGFTGSDGENGRDGIDGKNGIDATEIDISGSISLGFLNNTLTANLTVGNSTSSDEVEILDFSTINVQQVECVDGVAELTTIQVAVLKGTEAAEIEKHKANAKMLKSQCEFQPVAAAPDWWQVRIGANRPQIVCVFRKVDSRTYHSLTIPHPNDVQIPTEPILPAYQKGNIQGMIVLSDNSKFIINCVSVAEAERMCAIAALKIIDSYLPSPYKVWITERKGEPVGESQMMPTSIQYFSTGQRNLLPDWRFAIPPE